MEDLIKELKHNSNIDRPNIGVALTTYGATPYVHLHLANREHFYPEIPTIVLENNSPQKEMLRQLCKTYDVTYYSRPIALPYPAVEIKNIIEAVEWGKRRELEYMVKLSSRFLPTEPWVEGLKENIREDGFKTMYSRKCKKTDLPFRIEACVLKVDDFNRAVPQLKALLDDIIEGREKRLDRLEGKIFEVVEQSKGMGDWSLIAASKGDCDGYLHRYTTTQWYEFYDLAKTLGLNYQPQHFNGE